MRLLLLLMDIPFFHIGRKVSAAERSQIANTLKSGDIVLVADKLFPLWQLVIRLLFNSNYYHSAIYENNGQVIEATTYYPAGSGVRRTNVESYISGYKNVCIVRPSYATNTARQKAVNFAVSQLGKPYDCAIQIEENGSFYCAKLVAYALKAAGVDVKQSQFLGKKGFAPSDFIHTENTKIVYGGNQDVLPNLLLQVLLFAIICFLSLVFVVGFVSVIAGMGLLQFYRSPSNSVVRVLLIKRHAASCHN
jgi:hypothetical protein